MRFKSKIFLCIIIFISIFSLYECQVGDYIGPKYNLDRKMGVSFCIIPERNIQKIYLSRIYYCSYYSNNSNECDYITNDSLYIKGAEVFVYVDGEKYQADSFSPWGMTYYQVRTPFPRPGQKWELKVYHKDFDSVYACTYIPYPVEIISPNFDSLTINDKYFVIKWMKSKFSFGYKVTYKVFILKDDGSKYEINYNEEDVTFGDSVRIYISDIIDYYNISGLGLKYDNVKHFVFAYKVYSVNDGIFYQDIGNDNDIVIINFLVNRYTNIINGYGYMGAYWVVDGKEIIIPKELFRDYLE